jgi:hypothetical protein
MSGGVDGLPAWLGGAAYVIWDAAWVAVAVWLVLIIPVLVAGRALLRARVQSRRLWAGVLVVGLVLMVYIRVRADTCRRRRRAAPERDATRFPITAQPS